jgi:ferredoxin-like protein FixX
MIRATYSDVSGQQVDAGGECEVLGVSSPWIKWRFDDGAIGIDFAYERIEPADDSA